MDAYKAITEKVADKDNGLAGRIYSMFKGKPVPDVCIQNLQGYTLSRYQWEKVWVSLAVIQTTGNGPGIQPNSLFVYI